MTGPDAAPRPARRHLAIAIALDIASPYLGSLVFRRSRWTGPAAGLSAAGNLVSILSENGVLAGRLLLPIGEAALWIALLLLTAHAVALVVADRRALRPSWRRLPLGVAAAAVMGAAMILDDVRTLRLLSTSLEPLLPMGSLVSARPTDRLERGKLGMARDPATGARTIGVVLALPGDAIGEIEGRAAVCRPGPDGGCRVLESACRAREVAVPTAGLRAARTLGEGEAVIASFLDLRTREHLDLATRRTGTLYEVMRVFRPGAGTGLGERPPDPACRAVERVEGRRHDLARG